MNNIFWWAHETSIIETENIGEGTKIWAFSHISKGASIGSNCNIGEHVHIGNNVIIGNNVKIQNGALLYEGLTVEDNAFIGPGVVTTNDIRPKSIGDWSNRFRKTVIKNGASLGANSTIICGITIGKNSLVGAGSVVIKDVCENSTVVGNPARPIEEIEKAFPKSDDF